MRLLLGLLLFVRALSAWGVGGFQVEPSELALLPPYCIPLANRSAGDPYHPALKKWERILGKDYSHMHHYCAALLAMNRAERAIDKGIRHSHLQRARGEFGYVEKHATPGFVLKPELLVNVSIVQEQLGDIKEALLYAEQAVAAKPGYLKATRHLADLLVRQGARSKARAVLEEGLRVKPNAASLKRRIDCLDGKRKERCPLGYIE